MPALTIDRRALRRRYKRIRAIQDEQTRLLVKRAELIRRSDSIKARIAAGSNSPELDSDIDSFVADYQKYAKERDAHFVKRDQYFYEYGLYVD